MRVNEVMTRTVEHCGLHATLADATQIMWDKDCGFVPVVDLEAGKLSGVLTDRDACMAAFTNASTLHQIPVTVAMSKRVFAVGPEETVSRAMEVMRQHQVRRLPVVDSSGALVGVISLNDIVCRSGKSADSDRRALASTLLDTLGRISSHRPLVES